MRIIDPLYRLRAFRIASQVLVLANVKTEGMLILVR